MSVLTADENDRRRERVERAVICADGRVHYGPEYLNNDDPERVRTVADAHAEQPWCGGGPHRVATRKIITTAWEAA